MQGQWKLYVPINLHPDGPNLSFSFIYNYSLQKLRYNYKLSTNLPLITKTKPNSYHWCSQSCFCKNKCGLPWKYIVWNVSRYKTKSIEIYKTFVCFPNTDCTEISVFYGLNKTFIFSDQIQACQLAFVWACETDSCECSGQHNRDKSSQWVGRWGSKKSF